MNRTPSKPSRKALFICFGIFLLLVYSVGCVDYFEERDPVGFSKGIRIYPFYEHIEIYAAGGTQFPLGIDSIQLTKTPFTSTTYCQSREKTSIAEYRRLSEEISAEVYLADSGKLISSDRTASYPFPHAGYFSPLLHSGSTSTNIRLHTKFGVYDVCALQVETPEGST